MAIIDLFPEFGTLVGETLAPVDFDSRFRAWLEAQSRGALAPLIDDMVRHWSVSHEAPELDHARGVVRGLAGHDHAARAAAALERFRAVSGATPDGDVVLLAGLGRPEGYSRFDRGRNTVFIGLDHPSNLAHADHLEIILAHELTHAIRDPSPQVLADYGGSPEMSHDDFVDRHPFREHLVSEALATSISERAFPGRPEHRYLYFKPDDHAWCEAHRRPIAERMLRALADGEDYWTFYSRDAVAPGSPDCCDYYFGLHLGRFALERSAAAELLRMPSTAFLERFLDPFVESFLGGEPAAAAPAGVEAFDPAVLPPAVKRFYAELTADHGARPVQALAAARAFEAAVAREGLHYAGRPYDVCAFPLVLAAEDLSYLRWVAERLASTVEQVVELYRRDPQLRAHFAFPPHLERLVRLEPGYRPWVPIGRFDSFWNGKRVRFLELNTHGTAAIVLADRLGPLYLEDPALAALASAHRARPLSLVQPLADTLLDCWRQAAAARGRAPAPAPRRIAIVDWSGLPTASELAALAEWFAARGLEAVVADPAELDYDGRELRARGLAVELVYRRLTTSDLVGQPERLRPLVEACVAGHVVVVGPFGSDIAHSKRLFAVLTHERWREHFTMEQRALIDAHVPWTRMFRPGLTLHGGRFRDLRELATAERERFVLKPAEGAEGRDVLLGIEAQTAEWESEVTRRWGRDHVLQERVEAPVRTFLVPHGERVEPTSLHLHLGEYVFGGRLAGFLARASTKLVLSRTSDDRTLPCFVLGDEQGEEVERPSELAHP